MSADVIIDDKVSSETLDVTEFESLGVFETPQPSIPEEPAPETISTVAKFSEVAVKEDGTFVVTLDGNRSHVSRQYDNALFEAVTQYLKDGGESSPYSEDIVVKADPLVLAKYWVEVQIKASENIVSQYRDARDMEDELPITSTQFTALLNWRKAVRDWPKSELYPQEDSKPITPDWLVKVLAG